MGLPIRDIRIDIKVPLLFGAVLFLSMLFAYPGLASDQVPAYGDAIVVSAAGDARTLVPILASDSASSEICGMIFNGLVKYDATINITGDLAQSWEVSEDGLIVTFHLRRDVRWHDGTKFTSRDVAFTFSKLIDPAVKTPYSGDFERVKTLETPDEYTVKVTYKEPFSPALSSWGMWIMPEHVLRGEDLNKTTFARKPIGTGPYKFKSWRGAEIIELTANPDYFEGRPFIERYIVRIIPDEATIFLELQTQGVDLATLTPLQFTRQTDNNFFKKRYQKFNYPSFGYTYLGYNLSDPKFSDKRVRQAIAHAVDGDALVSTIFFGQAKPITGPFMAESWAYDQSVKPMPYDPAKAKALLEEAGWADSDKDGWLEKNGAEFEFTLLINQGNAERIRTAEIIQHSLKTVGIRMKIRVLEWSALINEFVNKRRFEAVLMGWFLSRDPDNYDIWHSTKTREGEFNFVGYKNTEVDSLLEEGRRTFDRVRREEIYHKIHRLIYDDQPYLFLYSPKTLPIVNRRFKGILPSPIGIGYNFIKWYVPKNEQRYQ